MAKSKETQLQRAMRKQRAGELLSGGTITIHVNGYSMDMVWRDKKEFYSTIDGLYESRDELWKVSEVMMNAENGVPNAKE